MACGASIDDSGRSGRVQYAEAGGELIARGTLDSRDLSVEDLRPRGTMGDLLALVEDSDRVITIG